MRLGATKIHLRPARWASSAHTRERRTYGEQHVAPESGSEASVDTSLTFGVDFTKIRRFRQNEVEWSPEDISKLQREFRAVFDEYFKCIKEQERPLEILRTSMKTKRVIRDERLAQMILETVTVPLVDRQRSVDLGERVSRPGPRAGKSWSLTVRQSSVFPLDSFFPLEFIPVSQQEEEKAWQLMNTIQDFTQPNIQRGPQTANAQLVLCYGVWRHNYKEGDEIAEHHITHGKVVSEMFSLTTQVLGYEVHPVVLDMVVDIYASILEGIDSFAAEFDDTIREVRTYFIAQVKAVLRYFQGWKEVYPEAFNIVAGPLVTQIRQLLTGMVPELLHCCKIVASTGRFDDASLLVTAASQLFMTDSSTSRSAAKLDELASLLPSVDLHMFQQPIWKTQQGAQAIQVLMVGLTTSEAAVVRTPNETGKLIMRLRYVVDFSTKLIKGFPSIDWSVVHDQVENLRKAQPIIQGLDRGRLSGSIGEYAKAVMAQEDFPIPMEKMWKSLILLLKGYECNDIANELIYFILKNKNQLITQPKVPGTMIPNYTTLHFLCHQADRARLIQEIVSVMRQKHLDFSASLYLHIFEVFLKDNLYEEAVELYELQMAREPQDVQNQCLLVAMIALGRLALFDANPATRKRRVDKITERLDRIPSWNHVTVDSDNRVWQLHEALHVFTKLDISPRHLSMLEDLKKDSQRSRAISFRNH